MERWTFLDEIQALARTGLQYANNPYDRQRYERLLTLAAESYTGTLALDDATLRARFAAETGVITPKVGADAAIFDADGCILLMERSDGTGWCLPCGWVEPNERPIDCAVRETLEETGLEVVACQLVGVFFSPAGSRHAPHGNVAVVHLCEVVGGALRLSHEGSALHYWPIDDVPAWHANHEKYARAAYRVWAADGNVPAISD